MIWADAIVFSIAGRSSSKKGNSGPWCGDMFGRQQSCQQTTGLYHGVSGMAMKGLRDMGSDISGVLASPLPAVANLCQCCVACPIFHISSFSPVAPPTSLAGSSSSFSQLPTQQVLRAANLCGDPIYVSPDVYAWRCGQMRRCARPCTARRHCPSATVPIVRVAGSGAAGCCRADAASMSLCKQQARISHISIQTVRTVVFLVIERSTARRNDPLQDGSQPARARTSPDPGCSSSQHADWAVRARRLQFLGCANSGTHTQDCKFIHKQSDCQTWCGSSGNLCESKGLPCLTMSSKAPAPP